MTAGVSRTQKGSAFPSAGPSIDGYTAEARKRGLIELCEATYLEPPSPVLIEAIQGAVENVGSYPDSLGASALRESIAADRGRRDGILGAADTEIVITTGASGGLAAILRALIGKGDEVLTVNPTYRPPLEIVESLGGTVRQFALDPPVNPCGRWTFERAALRGVIGKRTRCVLIASPHNPTGKVFNELELREIVSVTESVGAILVVDLVYEDFVYPPARLAAVRAMAPERVVTVGSVSKSLRAPGCRVGWVVAPREIGRAVARIHESTTGGVCLPAQEAVAVALSSLSAQYWEDQVACARSKRDRLMAAMRRLGLQCLRPEGGLSLIVRSKSLELTDHELAAALTAIGVAGVPMDEFYDGNSGIHEPMVRLAFGRADSTLARVEELIERALSRREAPLSAA
jgi:N-succinyldiaminopimelate aminotransferase